MSEFNWSTFQNMDPAQITKKFGLFVNTDKFKAQILTKICDNMSATYNQAIADETTYELDNEQKTVEELKKEIEEKSIRINILKKKMEDGTITEEEKLELGQLKDEIGILQSELRDAIAAELETSKGLVKKVEEQRSVRDTALVYSDETMSVGEKLLNGVKNFFEKLFEKAGIMSKTQRIGDAAVKSGANLKATVETSDFLKDIEASLKEAERAAKEAGQAANNVNTSSTQTTPDEEPVTESNPEGDDKRKKKE